MLRLKAAGNPPQKKRIEILDAVRGFAILAMVVYHALYDITDIFGLSVPIFDFFSILEPPFAGAFILLSGVSSRFSHSNFKRGVRVLALGLLITAFTMIFIPSQSIYFGILHFIGAAILLFALIQPIFDKISKPAALSVLCVLFALTYSLPRAYFIGIPPLFGFMLPYRLTTVPWLFPLGIPSRDFCSADYFPMVPWFFLFLIGTILGIPIREKKLPEKFYTAKVPFFAFAGRHTLLIYMVHQPLIYGILYLVFRVFSGK